MSDRFQQNDSQVPRFPPKVHGAAVLFAAVLVGAIVVEVAGFLIGLLTEPSPNRDTIIRDRLAWLQILPATTAPLLVFGTYSLTANRERDSISPALRTSVRVAAIFAAGALLVYPIVRFAYDRTLLLLAIRLVSHIAYTVYFVLLFLVSARLLHQYGAHRFARLALTLTLVYPIARLSIPVLDGMLTSALWLLMSPLIGFILWALAEVLLLRLYLLSSEARAASNRTTPILSEYRAPTEHGGSHERHK